MNKQPYIFKKQIVSLCFVAILFLIPECKIFREELLMIFLALLSIAFSPLIYKLIKMPIWLHSCIYYFPMYIAACFVRGKLFRVDFKSVVSYIIAIILISFILLWNRMEYIEAIHGFYSNISMRPLEFANKMFSNILALVSEEIFFRMYLVNRLAGKVGICGVLISSLAFLIAHYLNRWANKMFNLKKYASVFLLGIILSIVYYISNSIIPCIILHLLYNSSDFIQLIKKLVIKKADSELLFDDY